MSLQAIVGSLLIFLKIQLISIPTFHQSFFLALREVPLFSRSIMQEVIEFLSTLHLIDIILLHTISFKIAKKTINCLHCHPQCRNRVYHTVISVFLKGADVNIWSLAKFCHVCQQKYAAFVILQFLCNYLEFLSGVQTLRENHISSCVNIALRSFDALLQSIDSLCICPCANHKLSVRYFQTCLPGNFNLVDHLLSRNQFLTVKMSATFGKNLILDMKARCSRIEIITDRTCHHFPLAETRVSISDNWKIAEGGDILNN